MRQDKKIRGINIYKREFKISQFADDTSLICRELTYVENAIATMSSI